MTRGEDGELGGNVEYADGRVRRFRMSRDENGDLVGEELDPVGAVMGPPAADAGPATETVPEGDFAGVFGSLEDT